MTLKSNYLDPPLANCNTQVKAQSTIKAYYCFFLKVFQAGEQILQGLQEKPLCSGKTKTGDRMHTLVEERQLYKAAQSPVLSIPKKAHPII